MNFLKKEKLPAEVKTFRIKLVLGFLAVVLAVAFFPFQKVLPNNSNVVSDNIPTTVEEVTSLSVLETNMATTMLEEMKTLAPSELAANIGEQEQIDAILKAFHRLPGQELARLQIDLTQPVLANTPEAEALFVAWKLRQAELKEAMKNILKPAEFMTNITRTLNGTATANVQSIILQTDITTTGTTTDINTDTTTDTTTNTGTTTDTANTTPLSTADKVYLLSQLENLLDDVDNARDFHTIGAWPTLLSFLHTTQPLPVRTVAAWAVGSAVKNTYDYQLWTLESSSSTSSTGVTNSDSIGGAGSGSVEGVSALELLVDALAPTTATNTDTTTTTTTTDTTTTDTDTTTTNTDTTTTYSNTDSITTTTSTTTDTTTDTNTAYYHTELQKRALYALSSAMRGNMDVQDALMRMPVTVYSVPVHTTQTNTNTNTSGNTDNNITVNANTDSTIGTTNTTNTNTTNTTQYIEVKYIHYLHHLATTSNTAEVQRKVWASAADLLEERAYIRRELAHEVKLIQAALTQHNSHVNSNIGTNTNTNTNNTSNTDSTGTTTTDSNTNTNSNTTTPLGGDAASIQKQVDTAHTLQTAVLLGDHLINTEWLHTASIIAHTYATTLHTVEQQIRALAADPLSPEPGMSNSEQVAMHATLRSVFAFVYEALIDTPQLYEVTSTTPTTTSTTPTTTSTTPTTTSTTPSSASTTTTPTTNSTWQHQLQLAVRTVLEMCAADTEGAYESLHTSAQQLGTLLGLFDQE